MECTTASAFLSIDLYVAGFSMSAFSQETDDDHDGFSGVEVTEDHTGSPDLLIDVTSQPLPTAALQIREPGGKQIQSQSTVAFVLGPKIPRNPFPPHTTMRFLAIDKVIFVHTVKEKERRFKCS